MGWEEDYRQSQILAHTREMAETLKNIEHEQWKQNTYGSSSGGGGGIPLPSGKTMLKILGVMIVCGAVICPGSFFCNVYIAYYIYGDGCFIRLYFCC